MLQKQIENLNLVEQDVLNRAEIMADSLVNDLIAKMTRNIVEQYFVNNNIEDVINKNVAKAFNDIDFYKIAVENINIQDHLNIYTKSISQKISKVLKSELSDSIQRGNI
jgi:hypothetical protein